MPIEGFTGKYLAKSPAHRCTCRRSKRGVKNAQNGDHSDNDYQRGDRLGGIDGLTNRCG